MNPPGVPEKAGWAFGLGLERLAMVLFSIPDIRLFWSEDERFLSQFEPGKINQFKPYSKYPPCIRDMSFWIPAQGDTVDAGTTPSWHDNDYCEIVRDVAGDLIENVQLVSASQDLWDLKLTLRRLTSLHIPKRRKGALPTG